MSGFSHTIGNLIYLPRGLVFILEFRRSLIVLCISFVGSLLKIDYAVTELFYLLHFTKSAGLN